MSMWSEVSSEISQSLPQFNKDLLYGFRKRKIEAISTYLDQAFRQTVAFFDNKMTYMGYRILTPEERIENLFENSLRKGYVSIRDTETSSVFFEFDFQGTVVPISIEIPYLINECVVYNDTKYYPLFPIVEKGGVNVTDNGTVIVKVMRIPITFGRKSSDKRMLRSVAGNQYWDLLLTVKIYQGAVSKIGERLPLVLYPLCRRGFIETMRWFNIPEGSITVTEQADPNDKDWEYFMLPNGLYIKALKSKMSDTHFKRMVISLFELFMTNSKFVPSDVIESDTTYYCTTLGMYIGSKNREAPVNLLILTNAWKHLNMTDLMLDGVAIRKLASVGIDVKDTYDLLHYMYFNIDKKIIAYNPLDVYEKTLGSLDQLMAGIIRDISKQQYSVINSKRGANLTLEVIKTFCKKASQRASWIGTTPVFRPEPSVYNDCWLLTVGAKRFLSLDSIESQYGGRRRSTKPPPHLLRAHPSQIACFSVLDIPASTPIATGSLNPYLEVDEDGNVIKSKYAKLIEHAFD